jgi:hypothetical protein
MARKPDFFKIDIHILNCALCFNTQDKSLFVERVVYA